MTNKRVEIVTPVHNRRVETLRCLRSLSRIDRTGLDLHIIVVDDGSTDGTSEAIRQDFPDVEIIPGSGELFYTAGTNVGLRAALEHEPDYILAINDDSIFADNCVRAMVECAENHPRSVVGAILLLRNKPHQLFQTAPSWETWKGGWRHWHHQTIWTIPQKPWEVDLIVGNCVLYSAQAVKEVGFMDERFVQYGDAVYTPQMRRKGWRLLIEPRARVFCKPNDPRPKFLSMPFGQIVKSLFGYSTNRYNLHPRFHASLQSAPNRLVGAFAFLIFQIRWVLGRNISGNWGMTLKENPLSEVYADRVVAEKEFDVTANVG